ncbi:MAG: polyisoprenoid-binding protein [Caulobacter sp.]|nr:polyisoprenoid-binding protein [Caulobacter sp.]
MIRKLVFAIALLLAMPVLARAAPAPVWVVDKAASKIGFASNFGGDPFTGTFKTWDAQIAFDPKSAAGKVVARIQTGSGATGNADRDQALPTPGWFASAKYPTANFEASSFKALGGNRYQAIGVLSIKGVTKPLTLPFTLVITGDTARMTASVAVNRLAFGVGQGEWAASDVIPNPATVTIVLVAHRAK